MKKPCAIDDLKILQIGSVFFNPKNKIRGIIIKVEQDRIAMSVAGWDEQGRYVSRVKWSSVSESTNTDITELEILL